MTLAFLGFSFLSFIFFFFCVLVKLYITFVLTLLYIFWFVRCFLYDFLGGMVERPFQTRLSVLERTKAVWNGVGQPLVVWLNEWWLNSGSSSSIRTVLDFWPGGRGFESRPHFFRGRMLEDPVLRFRCTLEKPRWSKFSKPSTTAYLLIISWFRDIKPQQLLISSSMLTALG